MFYDFGAGELQNLVVHLLYQKKTAGELFSSSTVKVRNSMIYSLNLLDFPLINLQVYLAAPSPSQTHSLQHLSTANVPNNHNLGLKPHP